MSAFCAGLLIGCMLAGAPLLADPWGKDAELVEFGKKKSAKAPQRGPLIAMSEVLIGFHREVISPADGPRSHFKPSSSKYTLQAIQKHGFFWGFLMGCDRLMRENNEEWVYGTVDAEYNTLLKSDPVP